MNRIPTQGSRRTRVVSIVGLAAFFLITMLTMNFNVPFGLVKQAHAAALKPATTPALPSVGITSPSNNSLYTLPTQIPLTATATDSNPGFTITRVEFYSTSLTSTTPTLIGTVLTAPYTLTWTPSQPSIYTVTAKAYDRTGSQTSAPISVTVQIQAPPPMPAVTITSPANNALLGQYMRIPVTASFAVANPSSIVKVEFYATQSGGTAMLIGTATTAPYTITWAPQQGGSYTLVAKAYDSFAQVETSAPVSVFVAVRDPIPLNVTLTSPANNAVYSTTALIPVTASVSDPDPTATITKVDFYSTPAGGTATLIGTVTAAPYTITWTSQQPGVYSLRAQAHDSYPGDYGVSAPITITVQAGGTVTPTVTPPGGYCKVNYMISNQWPWGFTANITITNIGSTINGWTLAFTFPGDQKITSLWNGIVSQSGEQVTITNASWNGNLASQGTVSVGFNGSWASKNTNPTSFTLNGHVCS